MEGDLRAWADRNKNVLEYDVQEFADKVPLHSQVERAGRCDILFGPHGAGLAHEFWLRPGSHVIEISDNPPPRCKPYYGAMASWYGHSYFYALVPLQDTASV